MAGRGRKLARDLGSRVLLRVLMAAILPTAAAGQNAEQHSNLQGTWTLNEDLTARMRENDQQESTPHERSGGGMGRHGGGRRGSGGSFPGGSPGGGMENPGEGRHAEGQRPSLAALNTLTIAQSGNEVTITDQQGRTRALRADGSKVRDDKAPGGPAELQARWDTDGSLTVQVKPDKGPKRTESYIVSNDGKHLYLLLTMEGDGRRPEFKVRRAYDPAAPEEKPAAPPADPGLQSLQSRTAGDRAVPVYNDTVVYASLIRRIRDRIGRHAVVVTYDRIRTAAAVISRT